MMRNRRVLAGLLAGLLVAVTLVGLLGAAPLATSPVKASATSLSYDFYDFFNVPYGEWWDYRFSTYGDLPINADCFNQTSIADGVCVPSNSAIPDYATYPYTNWYPLPGDLAWNFPNNNPMVYAPYRLKVTGVEVPGYNRSEPVFLPVLNYTQPAGSRLDFNWKMNYLDKATGDALTAAGCPGVDPAGYDGFFGRSQITLTLDLQESKRIFNVVGTDQASAQNWWNTNTRPECYLNGAVENSVKNWFLAMGGGSSSASGVGKYDIANSFEWFYVNYYIQMSATVDPDGTTHVSIDHVAWGTEVMLARMFYWGNVSYAASYLDSTKAAGWWGMELAWFDGDFDFAGSLGAPGAGFSFTLNSAMQYHFQHLANPGANGLYDHTDDVPYWTWGPILTDYTNDFYTAHPASELDRYPYPYYSYVHSTPGGRTYGQALIYDYAPIRWDLQASQSWHFQFPTGDVIFYDPNVMPVPANPQGGYVALHKPLALLGTNPAAFGTWNDVARTWNLVGPSPTGGPAGTPGPDRAPGTVDDQYALESWGAISLLPGIPIQASLLGPWSQLYPGQTMGLTVTASAGGSPLPGAAVTATLTGAGSLTPTSGTTDASGKFTMTVSGSTSGTSLLVAASVTRSSLGYITGTASYTINIVDSLAMTAAVTSNRREMMSSEVATIRVNLTSGLIGVTGALLTPSTPLGGTFSSVRPLGSGNYEFDWTAPNVIRQTFVPINVLANAGGFLSTSGRVVILLDPNKANPTDPTQLFLLVRSPATSLPVGTSITVTVYVYTIEGYVVSGATMAVLRVGPGTVSAATDRLNGEYTFTYTAPASVPGPTGVLITINVSKLGYLNGTARLALTVTP